MAISIRVLPEWEVDWSDDSPQRDPHTLTISDILPSAGDAAELEKRAVHYVMHLLVMEFTSLNELEIFLPNEQVPTSIEKSVVIPMKILFKDEKYITETIDILEQIGMDAKLTGTPEVRCIVAARHHNT